MALSFDEEDGAIIAEREQQQAKDRELPTVSCPPSNLVY
jgi:hypothetical protein